VVFLEAAWRKRFRFSWISSGRKPLRPSLSCEGDQEGGKVSPGEKSFGKPSVVDREAERNATPRDSILLVCTHGMVVEERMGSKIRHVRENALGEFHGMMGQAALMAEGTRDRMMLSLPRDVSDLFASIDNLNRGFDTPKRQGEIVKAASQREPRHNMWSVINAYTLAAQSRELSVELSHRFQQVGGMVLSMVKK
jgi:hypothetical protein